MIRRCPNGATQYREAVLLAVRRGRTQGTETSKYLEEEKTKVISQVVASEREIAQTEGACSFGVVGLQYGLSYDIRMAWEGQPKRVIVPYEK